MVLGAIAYDTRSALVLFHGTVIAQWCVRDILQSHRMSLMARHKGTIFQQNNARPHFHLSLRCSVPRFITHRAYLRIFMTASWSAYEFVRIIGVVATTVERDVAGHPTGRDLYATMHSF
ncbi:uncharacterized protein TNCV_3604581 [Trichonephila clavipes]|nr:uncharacterized protein TNCV_3604581 [Trichonephila clavipes]